jgi:hypothetical protein
MIYVKEPIWSGVNVHMPLGFGYALEKAQGPADWDGNAQYKLPKSVDPGWAFRLWIGLDPAVPDPELRRRFDRVQVGVLTIPFSVAGRDFTEEFKI